MKKTYDRDFLRPLARALFVASTKVAMGVGWATAEKYAGSEKRELGEFWYQLAELVAPTHVLKFSRLPQPTGTSAETNSERETSQED